MATEWTGHGACIEAAKLKEQLNFIEGATTNRK
jgi:hypothetical protein